MMAYTQDRRFWIGGGALTAAVIVAAGWFMVISPKLSSTTSLRGENTSVELQNAVLQSKVAALKKQNDNLGALTERLQGALSALPSDSGLPAFTRQLSQQADDHKITLTSISVGAIGPVSVPAAAAVGTTPAAGAAQPAPSGAAAATPAGQLYGIPITLVSSGSESGQLAFLRAIQTDGPRRALVTSTTVAPGSGSVTSSIKKSSLMTIQLTVFTAPVSPTAKAQLEKLLAGDVSN